MFTVFLNVYLCWLFFPSDSPFSFLWHIIKPLRSGKTWVHACGYKMYLGTVAVGSQVGLWVLFFTRTPDYYHCSPLLSAVTAFAVVAIITVKNVLFIIIVLLRCERRAGSVSLIAGLQFVFSVWGVGPRSRPLLSVCCLSFSLDLLFIFSSLWFCSELIHLTVCLTETKQIRRGVICAFIFLIPVKLGFSKDPSKHEWWVKVFYRLLLKRNK